jgi:DNA-binding response OmpR family regulator
MSCLPPPFHPWQYRAHLTHTLPRLDGISMIRNIRQVDSLRQIPIVVLTSLGRPSEVADGINAGARSYLMKPVCLGDLESTLRRLVRRSKSLRPAPGHDSR